MKKYDDRSLSPSAKRKILEKYDYCCVYCYGKACVVDHVIPWSFDHDDSEENLVASCWVCNAVAGDKMFRTFTAKSGYIQKRREKFLKRRIIPLWTEEEIETLGRGLQDSVRDRVVVCLDEEERDQVKRHLAEEGWRVVAKPLFVAYEYRFNSLGRRIRVRVSRKPPTH